MDHLALVAAAAARNKMSAHSLATALAPPLMLQARDAAPPPDPQQPIHVLRCLLQVWPTPPLQSGNVGMQRPSGRY